MGMYRCRLACHVSTFKILDHDTTHSNKVCVSQQLQRYDRGVQPTL